MQITHALMSHSILNPRSTGLLRYCEKGALLSASSFNQLHGSVKPGHCDRELPAYGPEAEADPGTWRILGRETQ